MKTILELLILYREYLNSVAKGELYGMCIHTRDFAGTLVNGHGEEQLDLESKYDTLLYKYIKYNMPDYMVDFYKQLNRAGTCSGFVGGEKYKEWKKQFDHPHMGYWWKKGDLQPRLDWLD